MRDSYHLIRFEVRNQVATLTFNNPAKRNCFEPRMREEVKEVVGALRQDHGIRALVLTGAGDHFCSGGDLRNIATAGLDNAGWRERLGNLHDWLRDLLTLDRPIIAAVDGAAYGAGFSLALLGDFILATPRARFAMSFMKVGLVPDCAAFYTLPRIVGTQRARELMLSARELDAQEALDLGIVMELHPPEQLQARAQALAASFVQASAVAVALVKRTLAAPGHDLPTLLEMEANAQALAMGTKEHRDAVQHFLRKESPAFLWPAKT